MGRSIVGECIVATRTPGVLEAHAPVIKLVILCSFVLC